VVHAPSARQTIDGKTPDTLLHVIARSRSWIDALLTGKFASFDDVALAESLAERHVRRLAPLAFLSPKIVEAIADRTAPALPRSWADQEQSCSLTGSLGVACLASGVLLSCKSLTAPLLPLAPAPARTLSSSSIKCATPFYAPPLASPKAVVLSVR
jgi:hypothetical protein